MRLRVGKHDCFREILSLYIHKGNCKCLFNLCFTEQEKCEDTRKFAVFSLHSLCIESGDWNFLFYQNTRCDTEDDIHVHDNLKYQSLDFEI